MDSPGPMTLYICRLHPFPDGVASSTGLQVISRAVASRKKEEAAIDAALVSVTAPSAAARAATAEEAAREAGEAAGAVEVWQAAERLVEASAGEGGSSSRSLGSLLASLSRLRGALRRCTSGGSIGIGSGGGGSGGGSGGGTSTTSRDARKVANPYLDSSTTSRGIRQMHGRSPSGAAGAAGTTDNESSTAGERRGQPRPAPGASNKIQVRKLLHLLYMRTLFNDPPNNRKIEKSSILQQLQFFVGVRTGAKSFKTKK